MLESGRIINIAYYQALRIDTIIKMIFDTTGGMKLRLVEGFCVRKVLDETIAIPTQEAARYLSGLASMNETGEFIFELLRTEQTLESLVEKLIEIYEVDEETAKVDVKLFLQTLRENRMLVDEQEERK